MKIFIANLLSSAFVVAIALLAYDRVVFRPSRHIGVVDIGEVYRAKEAQFAQLLTESNSDDERQNALAFARQFAQRLPAALDELPRECQCLVMVKTAIAGATPNTVDLTEQLKRKVDL